MSDTQMTVTCPRCLGTGKVEYSVRAIFGLNVKRLRMAKGWTQERMATKVRATRPQLANIESGRSGTTLDGLLDFAKALGCSADELLKADVSPTSEESRE